MMGISKAGFWRPHCSRRGHPARSERGSTMVEFALTIMMLLVLLFGIVDFGRALYVYHYLANTARTATRWAAVNGATCGPGGSSTACPTCDASCNGTAPMNNGPASESDVENYVKSITPPGINWNQVAVTACGTQGGTECPDSTLSACATTVNSPGCAVQVTVKYNFPILIPIVHNSVIPLSSTSEMVIAH
jgi:Flp pilus assembly protein TadG